jgi:hypothetical protein
MGAPLSLYPSNPALQMQLYCNVRQLRFNRIQQIRNPMQPDPAFNNRLNVKFDATMIIYPGWSACRHQSVLLSADAAVPGIGRRRA